VEPCDEAAARELAQWLRRAVAELPQQQAAAFVLMHFENMSRDDAATALGVSPEAVSAALHRARQQITNQLSHFQSRR
jgi:RNA polymerase sigma factor (sigma-70 family)